MIKSKPVKEKKNNPLLDFQLSQIAIMHNDLDMSQQEIASKLGFSKMTVSRMLQKAKELDIIQITVKLPFQLSAKLSDALTRKFNLEKAIVVKAPPKDLEFPQETIGRAWAFYMGITLPNDCILGMGVGNTIGYVVKHLVPMQSRNLHIVQLMGGLSDVGRQNPFTIVQETCRKLNAKGNYFSSFAVAENKEVFESLMSSPMGQEIVSLWKKCTAAMFGVGSIESGTLLSPKLVSPGEIEKLKSLGVIGDVLGHAFNARGEFINTDLEERLVSVPIGLLKAIKSRIAVAGGDIKGDAIHGALKSGIITTLVTDEKTASALIEAE